MDHTNRIVDFPLEPCLKGSRSFKAAPPGRQRIQSRRRHWTVWDGHEHVLRQTLIALTANSSMSEHENPGEATPQVMVGRVRLDADGNQ